MRFILSFVMLALFGFTTAQATTVALSAPANAAKFAAGSNITISATATPTTGQTLTKVDFYQGTTLIATDTTSPYSIVWSAVPIGSYSLTAKATTNTAAVTTSAARTITVAAAPTVTLTAPVNNAAFVTGSTIALAATAAATGQTITKVAFYRGTTLIKSDTSAPYTFNWSKVAAGSYSLTAKVTTNLALTATSTAVAVTVAAAPTISLSAPANASTIGAGSNVTITATAAATGQTISKVDFYQGTTLLGTSTASPYSFIWSAVPTGNYSLTAKVTTSIGLTKTSAARTLTVAAAPTVTLTSPANNATGTAPASFTLTATTTNVAAQTISKVDFYASSDSAPATLLGTATTAPYSFTWSNVAAGSYSLTAKVTGSLGSVTTSTVSNVTVNALPTISLTAPANGTIVGVGSNVTLTATPIAAGQTIAQVDFYQGATLLGTSTAAPYSFIWNNVAVGSYSLTAKVTTNLGLTATSTVSTLTVAAAPTVSLTSPTDNTTTAPANLTLTATASSLGSTVSRVEFYANGVMVGQATTAPYSYTWSNVAAGSYSLTALAVDALGSASISTAINVTVNAGVVRAYYIHTDQIDTPRQITNTAGQVVWRWDNSDPFGNNPPNPNPSGQGTFEFNKRFSGQYADKETNTFYNTYRDHYFAELGRYGQSDPIGLAGGQFSTYTYVNGSPLSYVDPLGLYGTASCAYYNEACNAVGGYACGAKYACKVFPEGEENGWWQCVRQCLQEEHKRREQSQNSCPARDNPFTDHTTCFTACAVNGGNPGLPSETPPRSSSSTHW